MKYLATLLLLAATSTASAQTGTSEIHSSIETRAAHSERPSTAVARVMPLGAKVAFSVDVHDTVSSFPADFQDHIMTVNITNLTDSALNLQFHRHQGFMQDWTTSVCFGSSCYAPTADSSRTPYVFAAHSTIPLLLHFNNTSTTQFPSADTVRVLIIVEQEPKTTDTVQVHFTQITNPALGISRHSNNTMNQDVFVSVFPNPALQGDQTMKAQVYSPIRANGSISLYDLSGRKLRDIQIDKEFQSGLTNVSFSKSGLSSGAYILRLSMLGGLEVSERFEITR